MTEYNKPNICYCKFCNKICKSNNSLIQHEIRCKNNPNRKVQNNIVNYQNQIRSGERLPWNKGLTKETCKSIKQQGETVRRNYKLGLNNIGSKGSKNSSSRPEIQRKISEGMKKAHSEGIAHVWNDRQGKHASYPELWLEDVLKNNFNLVKGIDYIREQSYHGLFLDFFFQNKNLVIEIDGSQHYIHGHTDSDKRKEKLLKQDHILLLRCPWMEIIKDKQLWISIIENFIFKNSLQISKENKIFIENYRQTFIK